MNKLKPEDVKVESWPQCPPGHMAVGMPKGVKITHLPTQMVVICDSERSQHHNRDVALAGLQAMLDFKAVWF